MGLVVVACGGTAWDGESVADGFVEGLGGGEDEAELFPGFGVEIVGCFWVVYWCCAVGAEGWSMVVGSCV